MPSKKVISIFILSTAVVATIIIINGFSNNPKDNKLKNIVAVSAKSPEIKPGSNPDWQSDLSSLPGSAILPDEASSTVDETLTDSFSRSFMSNYLALKQNGPLNPTDATNLVNKSVEYINQTNTKKLEIKDIIISPDNSLPALTKYGNDLGGIAKNTSNTVGSGMEMALYQQMVASQSSDGKLKLIEVSKSYTNLAKTLTNIVVPSKFANRHLITINALNALGNAIVDLSFAVEDPTRSLRAISVYKENYTTLAEQARLTKVELVQAGVNYKQGENGYYFFFGI